MVLTYYIIFIELLLVSGLELSSKHNYLKKRLYWFNIIVLFLYASLKDPLLTKDSHNYINALNDREFILEPSFLLIKNIVNNLLSGQSQWLFIIYSGMAVTIKAIGIKRISPLFLISLLIWFSDLYLLHEITQIRTAVAGGFFILSIPSLYKKDLKSFLFWTFCAGMFHFSALIMLVLYIIDYRHINIKLWLSLVFISIIIAFIRYDLVSIMTYIPIEGLKSKYDAYQVIQSSQESTSIFSPLVFGKFIITIFLCTKIRILLRFSPYSILYIKIMFLSIIARFIFATNISIAFRISEFMSIIEILLFPLLIYIIKPRLWGYLLLTTILLIFTYIRVISNQLILS